MLDPIGRGVTRDGNVKKKEPRADNKII